MSSEIKTAPGQSGLRALNIFGRKEEEAEKAEEQIKNVSLLLRAIKA